MKTEAQISRRMAELATQYPDIDEWDATTAREFYYRAHVGEIPKGYILVPDCANDLCVNPDHICCVPAPRAN